MVMSSTGSSFVIIVSKYSIPYNLNSRGGAMVVFDKFLRTALSSKVHWVSSSNDNSNNDNKNINNDAVIC